MSARCWSRPAGGCRDLAPAGALRGAGGARPLDPARDAGGAAFAAALARLRRGERALRQRGQRRLRDRAAAVCRDRRGDARRALRHARRCRAGALHGAGDPLGEPALRRGLRRLGRAPRRRRRRARADGAAPRRAAQPWRLAQAACRRAALHALGLPGVRHRLPRGRNGAFPRSRPGRRDRARRLPAGARRHARLGRRPCQAAGARRAAVARGRAHRPGHRRRSRRGDAAPFPALVAEGSDPRTVHRAGPGAHRGADRPHLPRRGGGRRRRPGPVGRRLPGSLAGLARQRADRRLPPRLPPAGLPGADLPHRDDRRRGGGPEGVPEERAGDAAGRHRDRPLPPRPAGEGARLAGGDRAAQGRRAAGARLLHGRGLRPARCARRGRAGGARDLSRPGLAGERRALRAAPLLARLPADGLGGRARQRFRTHGPDEDPAHVIGGQPRAGAWRVARPAGPCRQPARALPDRAARPARLLVAVCQRGRQLQRRGDRQVGLGQVGADAGAGRRADRRRRRGGRHRRRPLVPAHRRGIGRRLHRLRQGPGLPQPLRHDRCRDGEP